MTNYKILTAPSSDKLEAAMNRLVSEGWKAQGGVTNGWEYAVLMVKEERGQNE